MPLYEYHCGGCRTSFEALVPLRASKIEVHPCPSCGDSSRRILSKVNFASDRRRQTLPQTRAHGGKADVTSLTLPPGTRLCWMDDQSAARLAAYRVGRGAEYDDTVAARTEVALQHGENESASPSPASHSHSPLSDPLVLANRRKAAQREKVVESASIRSSDTTDKA
jgi:putative FmdB family regulatory protein